MPCAIAPNANKQTKKGLKNDFNKMHARPLYWKLTNMAEKVKDLINENIYHVHRSEDSILLWCK